VSDQPCDFSLVMRGVMVHGSRGSCVAGAFGIVLPSTTPVYIPGGEKGREKGGGFEYSKSLWLVLVERLSLCSYVLYGGANGVERGVLGTGLY
jgi:hypothetical protein